jgi:rubredoxin
LKEKTELMRRQVFAVEEETAATIAMRGSLIEGSRKLAEPSDALWRALPRIGKSHPHCPECQLSLQAFPRATKVLLTCTNCGFVAKPLEPRHKRAALTR